MTVLPVKPQISPEQALLFVGEIARRLTSVPLSVKEYAETIKSVAERGYSGGRVYDALLLCCARKSKAQTIYTWNLKHFHALAPDLTDCIRTP